MVLQFLQIGLFMTVFGVLPLSFSVEAAENQEEILVGRIAYVEGKLLRYVEEEEDWVLTVQDSPFGLEDALYSGVDAKAEFIMPNMSWLRVGENTQIQLIDLSRDAMTVDVASGLARVYNRSNTTILKVTTPFGYVVAPDDSVFDLYVGDESLEVIAVSGYVDFVHEGSQVSYQVGEGSFSIIADARETSQGNGAVDADWDDWNSSRDDIWAQRQRHSEYSAGFLPEPIRDEAYALEENGRWERIYYEGAYRRMWLPTQVDRGWKPFTAGRWTVYYGDNCWIPDEPFGYVTHHYGSWVFIDVYRAWFWLPPPPRLSVPPPPGFSVSFGWYPGRVGWIHSGPSIGWVPLAPDEVYYGYRSWGRRTVVVEQGVSIDIRDIRFRFLNEAIIIDRDHFYRGSRYTQHVQRNVGRDVIINNYRPTVVINNTVINNFSTDNRRFTYNDVQVSRKPHQTVLQRISDNHQSSRKSGRLDRQRIEQDLSRIDYRSGPPPQRDLRRPMVAPKIVDIDKIRQPLDTLPLQKKEIKPRDRERKISIDRAQRHQPVEKGSAEGRPDTFKKDRQILPPQGPGVKEPGQIDRQQDRMRQPQEIQRGPDQKIRRPQQGKDQGPPEQGRKGAIQHNQEKPVPPEKKPQIKSPGEKRMQPGAPRGGDQGQVRPQKAEQGATTQQIKGKKQEEGQGSQNLQRRQAPEVTGHQFQAQPPTVNTKKEKGEPQQQGRKPLPQDKVQQDEIQQGQQQIKKKKGKPEEGELQLQQTPPK